LLACAALAAPAAACSSSEGDPGDGEAVGDLLGTFRVQLVAQMADTPAYTAVLGKIYDGVQPETVIWSAAATDGPCTLLTPRAPFCAPACGSTAACVADNTCQPYPASQDLGAVRLKGVATTTGRTEIDLAAVSNSYQPAAGTLLAYPPFDEGDPVEVAAGGSAFARAFTLRAQGVAPLALAGAGSLALAGGTPLALTWTAPGAAASSRIAVKLDISHHGGSKGKIECDADDTGALTIGAPLVDQLLALGAAGYPTIIVTREAIGHAAVAAGHADLIVSSQVEAPIAVPGVVSCTSNDDCTPPATCRSDLTCQ
jgi:hypothetical protein